MITSSALLQIDSYPFYLSATGIILIATWDKTTTPHYERSDSIIEGVTYLHSQAVHRSPHSIRPQAFLHLLAYL
jgi:hypothetical protein